MDANRDEFGFQAPTSGLVATRYGELLSIIEHPAFRLGFLDAQRGQPMNHDLIWERIEAETPASYFKRAGLMLDYFGKTAQRIELSQYRYEEGRLSVLQLGLRCKAWGHPDFPPAQLRRYIWDRADKTPLTAVSADSISLPRFSSPGPLFEARA